MGLQLRGGQSASTAAVVDEGSRLVVRSVQRYSHGANATYFTFPFQVRPYEPGRRRVLVRNLGTTNVRVGYSTTNAGRDNAAGNKPTTWEAGLVSPGQQYELGADDRMMFVQVETSGQAADFEVYAETAVRV